MKTKLTKLALTATLGLALAFAFGCSSDDGGDNSGGGSCNINGGTVKIGNQTWMEENLNCNVSGSKCYDNSEANCSKYGRLYDWKTAKTVCPSGWRLPSDTDWDKLINYVENNNGCNGCAGMRLKAKSGWSTDRGNGTDTYGFAALPGGFGHSNGNFINVGKVGYWWSSTESNASNAYIRVMYYEHAYVGRLGDDKSEFYSVRCVKN